MCFRTMGKSTGGYTLESEANCWMKSNALIIRVADGYEVAT